MVRRLLAVALVLTIAVGFCGCASPTPRAAKSTSRAPSSAPEVLPATAGEVLEAVRAAEAPAVLVNVWGTWCAPCREEFPDLMRLHAAYRGRGLRLILVSADFDDQLPAVQRYLAEQGVDFVSYLKAGDDMEFINSFSPRWSGALPATFIYDREGRLRHFREGKGSFTLFEKDVLDVLEGAPTPLSEEAAP